MNGLLLLLMAAGGLTTATDTLVEVRQGDRLVLQDFEGMVQVEAWSLPQMSLKAKGEETVRFRITRTGHRVEVRLEDLKSRSRSEELRITMPPFVDLELSGRELEVHVSDLAGDVKIRNLEGDLLLRNLTGDVDASTVEGTLNAINLTGTARLRTGDDDLTVLNSTAPLDLETVDGDIHLQELEVRRLSVRTTEGDIEFSGRALEGGEYGFYFHSGEIQAGFMSPVNLEARVLAYAGEFHSDFPVRTGGFRSGEGLEFTVGSGGARVVLETFDGDIELLRISGGSEE